MTPLNLASRPFRNERLGALAFGLATLAVLSLTAWQALALRRVLPAAGTTLRAEVTALDNELAALVSEEEDLLRVRPGREQVEEWRAVQALVDQRVFAWTRLLSRLEELLPRSVMLQSIAPSVEEGVATLELRAQAESLDDGYRFWEALLHAPEFEDVLAPSIEERPEGALFSYSMRYRPGAGATEPAAEAAEEPDADADDTPLEPASEAGAPEPASPRRVAEAR